MPGELPQLIELKRIPDRRGVLSVIEEPAQIPFKIDQVAWLSRISPDAQVSRDEKDFSDTLIVALSGKFDVEWNDGRNSGVTELHRSAIGLYCPCLMWYRLYNFGENTLVMFIRSANREAGREFSN